MAQQQLEKRYLGEPLQVEGNTVTGYTVLFDSPSSDLGGFTEIIKRGAFDATLAGTPDVVALHNHDDNRVLGRTKAGTLKLSLDQRGLQTEIRLPENTVGRDLAESLKRGDCSGCSFAFRVRKGGETWRVEGGRTIRELTALDLVEVSVGVTYPAYPDAAVAMRHFNCWQDEMRARRQWLAEASI